MHLNNNLQKLVSLAAAILVTLGLHGSLLAGFDHLATQAPGVVLAQRNCET